MTLDQLYQTYEEPLQRFAFKLARDGDLADDLVQETFIRSLAHLALLAQLNRHQCRAWLYQTLKRLYLDRQSARHRETAAVGRFALEVDQTVDADDTAGFDMFALVCEADRPLIEKRYGLGMNSREIAAALGIPAATVRSRLHLAVKKLRAKKQKFL